MGLFFDDPPAPPKGRPTLTSSPKPTGRPTLVSAAPSPVKPPTDRHTLSSLALPPKRESAPYLARAMPLLDGARGYAEFSEDGRMRYLLKREWWENSDRQKSMFLHSEPYVCIIGMNPSVAGANEDDKTIRNDIEFTRRLGFKSLQKVNLFPLCATDPAELLNPENESMVTGSIKNEITMLISACSAIKVVCAWGVLDGKLRSYAEDITKRLLSRSDSAQLWCYGVTQDGSPRHTSRLAHGTPCVEWKGYV
jgi:hypothetical protein